MTVFKRSVIYIKLNVIQSMILFFTIFLLGLAICGVVSIDRAIGQTEESLWRQLPTTLQLCKL